MSKDYQISKAFLREIMDQFIESPDLLSTNISNKLKPVLTNKFINDIELLTVIIETDYLQNKLISNEFLIAFIETYTNEDFASEQSVKPNLLFRIEDKFINAEIVFNFFHKLSEIIATENNKPFEERETFLKNILSYTQKAIKYLLNQEIISDERVKQAIIILVKVVTIQNNKISWVNKWIYIPLILELEKYELPEQQQLINFEKQFLDNANPISIQKLAQFLDHPQEFFEKPRNKSHIHQKAISNQDWFNAVYEFVSDQFKMELLCDLITTRHYSRVWNMVRNKNYIIPDKAKLANSIVKETSRPDINILHQIEHYKFLNEMNINTKELNIDIYIKQIKQLISQSDLKKRKLGIDVFNQSNYLNEESKGDIITDVLNGLLSNLPSNNNRIKHILDNVQRLPTSTADNLYDSNINKFLLYFVNNRDVHLLKSFVPLLSVEKQIDLYDSLLNKIYKVITDKNTQPTHQYVNLLTTIISSITKKIYFEVKENIIILTGELLSPTRDSKLHELSLIYLQKIKSYSKRIPKDLRQKVDNLHRDEKTTSEIRNQVKLFLS